jgi:antitoxin Phd
MMPIEEMRRLQSATRPSLKQLLLADSARTEMLVPERGKSRRRRATREQDAGKAGEIET